MPGEEQVAITWREFFQHMVSFSFGGRLFVDPFIKSAFG